MVNPTCMVYLYQFGMNLQLALLHSPDAGPLICPRYPGGGIGGITRLKGMGRFIAVIGLGPVPIIPIWSWVWKYILVVRPVVKRKRNN